jgi:hypothetical protein
MRIYKFIFAISFCFLAGRSLGQSEQTAKYRKFSIYAGAGPSYFFNNLQILKDEVNSFQYAFSARFMWEPQHSFLSLGIETGYYRLYTVNSAKPKGDVSNSSVPIMFDVSMRFGEKFYATWSMGQSITFNNVSNTDSAYNFNASTWSLSDFEATLGYRFTQKERISYAVELKGFYSSGYQNTTIALLFIVGFKL